MKRAWGVIVLMAGLGLLSLPFRLLGISRGSAGDGGPNFIPLIQAAASLGGAFVAFIIAWHLLKREGK